MPGFLVKECPWSLLPDSFLNTIFWPSDEKEGVLKMPFSEVIFVELLPETGIFLIDPSSKSFQVTKTISFPFGEKAGSASKSVPEVSLFGVPLGTFFVHK